MGHIYEDIAFLTGEDGIMTHQLPNASKAMEPWLRSAVTDDRFWDGKYDTTHTGEYEIDPMTPSEAGAMFDRFAELRSPLLGKEVTVVAVE
jgi:hypothetical protein